MLIDDKRIQQIARVCHQAHKAWCEANGQTDQVDWRDAPRWKRDDTVIGVEFCIQNPSAPPSALHDEWVRQKQATGWVYGPTLDTVAKTHPCMVPFDQLSEFQRRKDMLFHAIVTALVSA